MSLTRHVFGTFAPPNRAGKLLVVRLFYSTSSLLNTQHSLYRCIKPYDWHRPKHSHQLINKTILRYHSSKTSLYYWNDVLFGSSFNDIVRTDFSSTDQNVFKEKNFIKSFDRGFFSLLPFVVRAYERLVTLIDHEMQAIGCQKIIMPAIVGKHLWVKSERWEASGEEVFRVLDRHKEQYCLAPTQEETVTQILASIGQLSYGQLPIYLYQITPKFRDELRTKYGLLRAREFTMKDLYTFDKNMDLAKVTYEKVCHAYERIFAKLELPVVKTVGSVGSIGGKYSHEWLLPTPLGEDEMYSCLSCQESFNAELVNEYQLESKENQSVHCLNCKSKQLMPKRKALELGHSFLLSDRYSNKMGAYYLSEQSNLQTPLQMGCYGLGLSRILAASVEYLTDLLAKKSLRHVNTEGDTVHSTALDIVTVRWPKQIVPFKICLILPKKGSKEDRGKGTDFATHLARLIEERFVEDVLLDDRSNLSIGKRLLTARAIGIPIIIVAGRNIIDDIPKFEVINTHKIEPLAHEKQSLLLTQNELLNYLEENLKQFVLN